MSQRSSFAVLCLAVSGSLTTACMPMEQAPLVYASKHQFGVAVAAGTADSPGLDVSIGYKDLDAAFVPVAVAKNCKAQAGQTCSSIDYSVKFVKGFNKLSGLTEVDAKLLTDTQRQLDTISADREKLAAEIFDKGQQLKKVEALAGVQLRIQALEADDDNDTATSRVLTAGQTQELNDLRAERAATPNLTAAQLKIDLQKLADRDQLKAVEAERLKVIVDRITAQRRRTSTDTKDDALSVYGSFGGNANGTVGEGKAGAGLTLGKVFSTGVAAQNVSQGIRNAAKLSGAGECMARAKELIGPSQNPGVLIAALNACKPPVDSLDD